jgi:hypothetical protein
MDGDTKIKMLEMYNSGMDGRKISELLNLKVQKVYYELQRMGYQSRSQSQIKTKYKFDENFLEIIDCEWKAYYLGFLYADGNLYQDVISLHLAEKDKFILDKFNQLIFESLKPIKKCKRYSEKSQVSYVLNINNKKCAMDVFKLGIVPKKSLILKFPNINQVPLDLMNHFIRGYFDGDGCITKTKWNGRISICGSSEFCIGLKKYLGDSYQIESYINKHEKIHVLSINKKDAIKKFYSLIYDETDSELCLPRKRDLMKIIIDDML